MDLSEPFLSLDSGVKDDGSTGLQDFLVDRSQSDSEIGQDERHRKGFLSKMMLKLKLRERQVIRLYYGLDTGVASSLGEIANRFGISRERVRQIRKMGLINLEQYLRLPLDNGTINGHA